MAKAPDTPKKNRVKKVLTRRVDVTKSKALGRDVHTPRWLRAIGGYFKGSYQELRQVRWPTRRATWGFTLAVILFTASLALFILGLDYVFELLFKKVIL